jgi:hypothetical protein
MNRWRPTGSLVEVDVDTLQLHIRGTLVAVSGEENAAFRKRSVDPVFSRRERQPGESSPSIGLDTVLIGEHLPELGTDLVTTL